MPVAVGLEPEVEIAMRSVFLLEMLNSPVDMLVLGKFGIVLQAILQGTPKDGIRVEHAVGFGDEAAIERAWRLLAGSAVVFDGLGKELYLIGREERRQESILPDKSAGMEMVEGAIDLEPYIMIGGDGVSKDWRKDTRS